MLVCTGDVGFIRAPPEIMWMGSYNLRLRDSILIYVARIHVIYAEILGKK